MLSRGQSRRRRRLLHHASGGAGATHFTITQQPAKGWAAITGLLQQPVVEARNTLGIKDTSYTGSVTASIASGSIGIISGATVTFVAGVGTWTALKLSGTEPAGTLSIGDGVLVAAVSSAFSTDFLAVRDAAGGDAAIKAIYTTRVGLTASGANFTSLSEARAGFGGPTLPQIVVESGTPGWDATNKLITVDGSSSSCKTAVDAAFNLDSPVTYSMYAFGIGAANGSNLVGIQASGRWLALQAVSSHYWLYYGSFGNPTVNSPSQISSTRRQFKMGFDALSTSVFDVWGNMGPNKDYAENGGAFAADSCQLKIGNGATGRGAFKFSAFIKTAAAVGSALHLIITQWGAAYESTVEDKVATHMVFVDGDSRVEGNGPGSVVNGSNDIVTQLFASAGLTTDRCYVNCALGGTTLAIMLSKFDTKIGPALIASTAAHKIVLVPDPGFNDVILNGSTAAAVYVLMKQYNDAAKAAGATVVLWTTAYGYQSGIANGNNAIVFAANALLQGNSTFTPDDIADIASEPHSALYTNTTYFFTDDLHGTATLYGLQVSDPTVGIAAMLLRHW